MSAFQARTSSTSGDQSNLRTSTDNMSSAMERYLKEDDPLKKTLATGEGELKSANGASAKGVGKGSNPASGHTPADTQATTETMEDHMREHQEQCQCARQRKF